MKPPREGYRFTTIDIDPAYFAGLSKSILPPTPTSQPNDSDNLGTDVLGSPARFST